METFKKNIIYVSLTYVNIFFIMRVMEKCFKINNFSYVFFNFLFILAAMIYYLYRFLLKRPLHKFLFTFLMILSMGLWVYFNMDYFTQIFKLNIKYVMDLNNNIYNGETTYFYQLKLLFIFTIPLLIVLILWIGDKVFPNCILLVTVSSMLFFWNYGYTETVKKYTFYFILISIITYSINSYIRSIDELKSSGVGISIAYSKILLYIVILGFLISGVQSFLPKEIQGKYNKEKSEEFINKFSINRRDIKNVYNLSSSGYNNTDTKLGGPITIDNKQVFKVKADRPYYLRGTSKEYYDGFSWKGVQNNYGRINKDSSILEPKSSNSLSIVGESKIDYITIYPDYISTSTLFAPMYATNINIKGEKVFYDKDNNFVTSNDTHKEYTVKFYNDDLKYSVISDNIDSKKNIITTIMDYGYKHSLSLEPEKFKQYNVYLQLPDNIPKRVFDLVDNITSGEKDPGEKVFKIYDYLHKNYKYSLQVQQLPEGKEFVDNFLFTEKKGYCTYFATAATVMCRIAGIPARYVEGFNMTYDKDADGLFIVSNKNSHAWAEILIDPISNSWSILDTVPSAPEEVERAQQEERKKEAYEDTQPQETNRNNVKKTEEDIINKEQVKNEKKSYWAYLLSLLLLIILLIIARILMIIRNKRKIIKSKSIIPLYLYIIKRIRTIGIYKDESQGEKEFIQSIEDISLRFKMEELVEYVYKEFYGEKEDTVEYNKKEELYKFIEKYIKENQGKGKYYVVKFLNLGK
ncbi:Protein-glutamine gamma-glutamyltransferase [Clostridium liquoris]|jgi:hypothetical protein|uniref:Protein-glutamine gamma-glutamyltransferase n=1 Tax=Clostridium liquoris TaxID=1289519 RepID=A0A2T0B6D4_9CLOT|nr:transglutaminase domain-containing protein [Clostridium liquoris]PRR79454.1 Protein-glutamine gamma-glutamyltransferase [Clostridium liquoris]